MIRIRLALGVGVLGMSACLLYLDEDKSCGDRFVHEAAGEECEPGDPETYDDACRTLLGVDLPGACDPNTCTIDFSACTPECGNGVRDPGEECDPGGPPPDLEGDEFAGPGVPCVQLPPLGSTDYASGTATRCNADCTWDRTPCNHCGDLQVQPEEQCDTTIDDLDEADAFCMGACLEPGQHPRPEEISCQARCSDDCQAYVPSDEGLRCCIPNGQPTNPHVPCCGFADGATCRPGLDG